MEECELCGRKISTAYIIEVGAAHLRVCQKCAEGKKVVAIEKAEKEASIMQKPVHKQNDAEMPELIENYGNAIRNARNRMQLPLKVLAEMINEKESLLLRIEENKAMPSLELAKKLEKALHIKLEDTSTQESYAPKKGDKASLGEFFKQ